MYSVYVFFFSGVPLNVELQATVRNNHFILTCSHSPRAPASFITWTRDSEEISGGETVSVVTNYRHVLNTSEEGVYACTVITATTSLNFTDTATLNVTSMYTTILFCIYSVHFYLFILTNSTITTIQSDCYSTRSTNVVCFMDTNW